MTGRLARWRVAGTLAVLCTLAAGCGYEPLPGQGGLGSTTQAADYYPFAVGGNVIRWRLGATVRIELPDCPYLNCLPGFRTAVAQGISVWAPLHAVLGLNVIIDQTLPPIADDVTVIWDDGCGASGFSIAPGVIGFAAVASPPADPSRFIVMTSGCNTCGPCPDPPPHDLTTIQAITIHEWGHMLGIWNHSFDPQDFMYPYRLNQGAITNRDSQTLFQAYRVAPDLDLASLPKNSWSQPAQPAGEPPPTFGGFLLRYQHSYGEPRRTTLEFNPPLGW